MAVQYLKMRKRESKTKKYSVDMVRVVSKESVAKQAASAYTMLTQKTKEIERIEAECWAKARTRTIN